MDKKSRTRHVVVPTDMERYHRQTYRLNAITEELVKFVSNKDFHYGSSWRKRGGAGAFFVISRKWDRIEQACETLELAKYDIFEVFKTDDRGETILDDCLDLVGYLLVLVEHMIEIGHVTKIEELHMNFDCPYPADESDPSGMLNPHGFEEEEDLIENLILDTKE